MIKRYCDLCGREAGEVKKVKLFLFDENSNNGYVYDGILGYNDHEICLTCRNAVSKSISEAVKQIKAIKKNEKIIDKLVDGLIDETKLEESATVGPKAIESTKRIIHNMNCHLRVHLGPDFQEVKPESKSLIHAIMSEILTLMEKEKNDSTRRN
jgi:hypothetical protein